MRSLIAMWGSWKVRAGAMIAALLFVGSVLVQASIVYDNATSFWRKLEILYSYAATPWVGVFALGAVIVLVAWGIKDVASALEKGDVATTAAIQADTELRRQMLEEVHKMLNAATAVPNALAELYLLGLNHPRALECVTTVGNCLIRVDTAIAEAKANSEDDKWPSSGPHLGLRHALNTLYMNLHGMDLVISQAREALGEQEGWNKGNPPDWNFNEDKGVARSIIAAYTERRDTNAFELQRLQAALAEHDRKQIMLCDSLKTEIQNAANR